MLSALHIRLQIVGCRDMIISLLYAQQFETFTQWNSVSTYTSVWLLLFLPRRVDNRSTKIIPFNVITSYNLLLCVFNHFKSNKVKAFFFVFLFFLFMFFFFFRHHSSCWTSAISRIALPSVPGPVTYVSSSSRPCSLGLSQLTQATSTYSGLRRVSFL